MRHRVWGEAQGLLVHRLRGADPAWDLLEIEGAVAEVASRLGAAQPVADEFAGGVGALAPLLLE